MSEKIRIAESNIPAIIYDSTEDVYWDHTKDTKNYLRSFKPEQNRYDNEFAFIFKIKYMKKWFIVVNCFSSGFFVEFIDIDDKITPLNGHLEKALSKSSYNLKKALSTIEKYQNMRLKLTKRYFKMLFFRFLKAYKKMKRIYEYDYTHITKHLKELQNNISAQGYYYLREDI